MISIILIFFVLLYEQLLFVLYDQMIMYGLFIGNF